MTKNKSVFPPKCTPVVSDNNDLDSDTVDILVTTKQPDDTLSIENSNKKKTCVKLVLSAKREDALIDGIGETPCLNQKGLR